MTSPATVAKEIFFATFTNCVIIHLFTDLLDIICVAMRHESPVQHLNLLLPICLILL